eukprot:gene14581-17241_t
MKGASMGPQWYKFMGGVDSDKINKSSIDPVIEYGCGVVEMYSAEQASGVDGYEPGWNIYVRLTNGKLYGSDFLVSATGVVPNDDSIKVEPVAPKRDALGYIVDKTMSTSIKDIYAAGDTCSIQWPDQSDHWFQMKLWSQARTMGRYAAQCIAKHSTDDPASIDEVASFFDFELFAHATRFFNLKVVMLGRYNGSASIPPDRITIYKRIRPENHTYVKIILVDGRLYGALLIGETDLEETFENLILNRIDLTSYGEAILNPDIDIEDYFD